jgi:DNA primase
VWLLKTHFPGRLYEEYIRRFCDEKALKSIVVKAPPVVMPGDYRMLATRKDSKNPEIRRALNYLEGRGIGERDLWYFKLGLSHEGMFDNRLIIPSFDRKGKVNFLAGRALMPYQKIKYFLSKTPKKEIIFNEINIDWSQELTITEGPFDLIKCNDNATCMNGSSLPSDSLLFVKIVQNKTPVLLALDEDMQYTKTPKLVRLFMKYGVSVRVLPMGEFSDVGSMSKKEFKQLAKEAKVWNRMSIMRQRIRGLI